MAFQGLSRFLTSVLGDGYQALPNFWVWHVNPNENALGWGPHRDRVIPTLDADYPPRADGLAAVHRGGRGSRLGSAPRISAAFEFQRADRPPFNNPLLDPARLPTFQERLGLIGKQVLQYRHMYPLSDEVGAIATSLLQRFMPGVPIPAAYPVPTRVAAN